MNNYKYILDLIRKIMKINKKINFVFMFSILVGILVPFILLGNISLLYKNYKNLEYNNRSYNYCVDIMNNKMIDEMTYNKISRDFEFNDIKLKIYDRIYINGNEEKPFILNTVDTKSKLKYKIDLVSGSSLVDSSNQCLINYKVSKHLKINTGDFISIGQQKYIVRGIFRGEMTDIYLDSNNYAKYLISKGKKLQQWIYINSDTDKSSIENMLSNIGIHDHYEISENGEMVKIQMKEYKHNIRNEVIMSLMCTIYLLINLFIVIKIKTSKNKKLIYILLALGMNRRKIYSIIFIELLLLTLVPAILILSAVLYISDIGALINYVHISSTYMTGVLFLTILLVFVVTWLSLREYFSKTVIDLISDGDYV